MGGFLRGLSESQKSHSDFGRVPQQPHSFAELRPFSEPLPPPVAVCQLLMSLHSRSLTHWKRFPEPVISKNAGNLVQRLLPAMFVEDKFEDLREVSKVDMKGVMEREVQIEVDLQKMQALQVSYGDIAQAVGQENLTMSGGEILSDEFRRNIRILGQFEDPAEIQDIIVKSERQRPIYLRILHLQNHEDKSVADAPI